MANIMRYGQQPLSRRASPQEAQEFLGVDDRFRGNIEKIRDGRNKMDDLNRAIRTALEPGQSKAKYGLARMLQFIPERVRSFLPEGMTRFESENTNGLEMIASYLRWNANNIQGAVAENIEICGEKKKELDHLADTIRKADEEQWPVSKLQEYMARQSHIAIRPEITSIFNANIGLLSERDQDVLRQSMLSALRADEARGRKLIEVSGEFCSAMVGAFHVALMYLHSYELVYRHYAIIGESAKDMANLNNSMFISRAGLEQTLDVAVEIMEDAVDAFDQAARAVSSDQTQHQLEQSRIRIRSKINQLQAAVLVNEPAIEGEVVRPQLTAPEADKSPN